jgi:hypothetical protein
MPVCKGRGATVEPSTSSAEVYRRYAAECLEMARRNNNVADKAMLVQMATMWQRLAELADRNAEAKGD